MMAQKTQDVLVLVVGNHVEPINIWLDNPTEVISDILSIEGVLTCSTINAPPLRVMVDPRYNTQEVAEEIETLLTADIPDVFKQG
jgi:hypothetical protein